MNLLKKGDIVSRKSHNNDVLFCIEKLTEDGSNAILKGVVIRIEADSPVNDLVKADETRINALSSIVDSIINTSLMPKSANYGKILHLDGDRAYSQKTEQYYRKRGLNYVVKHISEHKQPEYVVPLIQEINPDILVITGHDGMIRKGRNFNDINNYRNSKHFIRAVRAARQYNNDKNDLIIYAGACQSYYEALISVGANFASSPARILIDFVDPLIVAESIAVTDKNKIVFMSDLEGKIRNGRRAVGGIGAKGKKM